MTLYWHPFLTEMLRLVYSDRLVIRDKLPLGDLPLEADLLLIRRDPGRAGRKWSDYTRSAQACRTGCWTAFPRI